MHHENSPNSDTDLEATVRKLGSILELHAQHRKPAAQPSFNSIALGRKFKADLAAPIIAEADPGYPGIAKVLFLGFCGWVVLPSDVVPQRAFMYHAALDHIGASELQAGLLSEFHLSADILARYVLVGPDFLDDIFYALKGHLGVSVAVERPTIESWLSGEHRSIFTLVKLCQILHFAANELTDDTKYRPPSLTLTIEIMSAMRDDDLVERTIFYQAWKQHKSTVALLYAASTIKGGKVSLLDSILSGEIRAEQFMDQFPLWIGRARYFCDHVLSRLAIRGLAAENLKPLKRFKTEPFAHYPFPEKEGEFLRRKYSRN